MHNKRITLLYLKKLQSGKCTLKQASESTGYSLSYISVLKRRYLQEGAQCLENKNKFREPSNKIESAKRKLIADMYIKDYDGYNFSFFNEILAEDHNINISYKTLYNILTEYGIKSPEKHHTKKTEKNHRTRPRRMNEGDLMQIDGTPFPWFAWAGDKQKYCIVAGVDDATGKLTGLYMTENECLSGYMELMRLCYIRQGFPREIYSDRSAIFCVTPRDKDKLTVLEQLAGVHEKRTQWQRILEEINIRQILAWTPQAKGRVERMWHTLQDRLPHYFRKHKIKTMAEANRFMENEYLKIYNERFAREPKSPESFYTRVFEFSELDEILCARYPSKTNHNGEFKFKGVTFGVLGAKYSACKPIEICISEKGIFAYLGGQYYDVELLDELTEKYGERMPKVTQNIIYEALLKDMKKESS